MNNKISGIEAFFIMCMFSINTIILNAPKLIIENNQTGAFINSIYIGIIALIFLIIMNKLLNYFPNFDILDIANFLGGKIFKIFIGFLFILIFSIIICTFIAQFIILLKTVYFKDSPILFILMFFILCILFSNLNGFISIKNSICFYFPISIITLSFIFINNISNFTFIKVTPVFGQSFYNTFIQGFSNIFVFTNLILILFLPPFCNNSKSLKKATIFSLIFSCILLTLTIGILLSIYPFDNSISNFNPLYSLTRRIELSQFIERADALFVTIALFSCFSYIGFLAYLITQTIKKIFILENEKILIYSITPYIIGFTFLLINTNTYNKSDIYKNLFNITIYIISPLILFISALKKKLM